MKNVKFVLVGRSRGEVEVVNIEGREGESVSKVFEEVGSNLMREDFKDEEEFEMYVEEWCDSLRVMMWGVWEERD